MQLRNIAPACLIGAALLGACSSDKGTGPAVQTATVRVVNVSSTNASVGLFAGNQALGSNVNFGSGSATCVNAPVGQSLSFRAAGQTANLATIATPNLSANQRYTVVLHGAGANVQATVLNDAALPTPTAGNNALRFFNATGTAGDIWVTTPGGVLTGAASASNLAAGQATAGATAFGTFPTANTQVRLFNTGTTTGAPRVTTTVNTAGLSQTRVGTLFLTETATTGGTNASFTVAPCD
jgi:hypothetical protein